MSYKALTNEAFCGSMVIMVIITVLLVVILVLIGLARTDTNIMPKPGSKMHNTHENGVCRPHSWERKANDELICKKCGKKPGDQSFYE